MSQEIVSIVLSYIQSPIHMAVDPAKKIAPQRPFHSPAFIQQGGISPEEDRQSFLIVPHDPQMTKIIPSKNENGIGLPVIDLLYKPGVPHTEEIPAFTAVIRYELIYITFQQRDIPFNNFSEI